MGQTRTGQQEDSDIAIQDRNETKEPSMYEVLLLNDHYTTMEFVVSVLEQVFHKSSEEAARIMLAVHREGQGVAGVYTREIAETKIAIVHQVAREHQFPLRCSLRPA